MICAMARGGQAHSSLCRRLLNMLPQVSRLALSASTRNTSAVSKAANPSLKAQIRPQRSANFTSRFGSFNAAFTSQSSFTTSIAKRYYSDQLNQGWTKPPPGAEELMNKLSQKREEEAHEPEGLVRKGFGGVRISNSLHSRLLLPLELHIGG